MEVKGKQPRYVTVDPSLCAHSRNGKVGCTRCLDVCPSSSIKPAEDHVEVDPSTCSGHGSCSAVCPTSAIIYAAPAADTLFERMRVLLATFLRSGGVGPQLLLHDDLYGGGMIQALARLDRGLPAAVLPFAVHQVTAIGLDHLLTAFAHGAGRVMLLVGPPQGGEQDSLAGTVRLAEDILGGLGYGGDRVVILAAPDPTALDRTLHRPVLPAVARPATYQVLGRRRETLARALDHLHAEASAAVDVLPLAAGSPFGGIILDGPKCTLCLSCVGVCPTGAIGSSKDKPLLSFQESSCIQCDLCRVTCPENAIALAPRLLFGAPWRQRRVLKEEEPFVCIRCGKPFGTAAMIAKMIERLGNHPMFQGPGRLDLLKMCDNCRALAQIEGPDKQGE